jgi:hypothetical protein
VLQQYVAVGRRSCFVRPSRPSSLPAPSLPTRHTFNVERATLSVSTSITQPHSIIAFAQGLNRIAAMFLLILDEETTFWGLVAIVERVMTYEYFVDPLIAARIDMEVVCDLVSIELPALHRHFVSLGFDVSVVCFQWLFSLFVTCLLPTVILRIWDSFLIESCKSAEAGREVRAVLCLRIIQAPIHYTHSFHDKPLCSVSSLSDPLTLVLRLRLSSRATSGGLSLRSRTS